MKEIDAKGLACPAPVLLTKEAIEKSQANLFRITVDNEASRQNVCRFLESQGFDTSVQKEGNVFHITGKRKGEAISQEAEEVPKTAAQGKKIMIMIATDCMGHGDDVLGSKLMTSFISTLKEMGPELWRLVFVNSGVKLTIDGSEVLAVLRDFEENGLHILVCGTCLTHFDLLEQKQVGETTNMLDIVTAMQLADQVINI
ncbi:MAG: SirA family protein [Desulfobacteraceae bacterium 4572_88]|nr:MAG: SirA family protein [Desulfobacteraceae bacterium 4572_88]